MHISHNTSFFVGSISTSLSANEGKINKKVILKKNLYIMWNAENIANFIKTSIN